MPTIKMSFIYAIMKKKMIEEVKDNKILLSFFEAYISKNVSATTSLL